MRYVPAFTIRKACATTCCACTASLIRSSTAPALTVGTQDESFVDQVTDVIDQIDQYVANLLGIRDVLQPLETLRPDGTDFFER